MIKKALLLFCSALLLLSCGKGATNNPNDPAPTGGTIVATGAFSSPVTGTVTVYSMGAGSYIIRLVSLNVVSESGLQMIPVVNGANATVFTLRASTGNQNYSFTGNGGVPTWNKIVIHSTVQNRDLGEAPLTASP